VPTATAPVAAKTKLRETRRARLISHQRPDRPAAARLGRSDSALPEKTLFANPATIALIVGAGKVLVLTYMMPFWLLLLAWLFPGSACVAHSGLLVKLLQRRTHVDANARMTDRMTC
jgi:hypothetical protein